MSSEELTATIGSLALWKFIVWCCYPMLLLIALELFARILDDDDDQNGGKMIPALDSI